MVVVQQQVLEVLGEMVFGVQAVVEVEQVLVALVQVEVVVVVMVS